MEYERTARASGKTAAAVKYSAETGLPILAISEDQAAYIKHIAQTLSYRIPDPCVIKGYYTKPHSWHDSNMGYIQIKKAFADMTIGDELPRPGVMSYVLVFLFSEDLKQVYLVYKTKGPCPNTLNGIGGKVDHEREETFKDAAIRESIEEIGLVYDRPLVPICKEELPTSDLVVYAVIVDKNDPKPMEDEPMDWYMVRDVIGMDNSKLADDLKYYLTRAYYKLEYSGNVQSTSFFEMRFDMKEGKYEK